jgi:ubiquinone/menaquinone biosynthesis C-methylase UbiE
MAFIQAGARAIPLMENSADRITCRCGVMFFDDTDAVLSEALRVPRPEGRAAFLVWGPFEQPLFDITVASYPARPRH